MIDLQFPEAVVIDNGDLVVDRVFLLLGLTDRAHLIRGVEYGDSILVSAPAIESECAELVV